jgi:anti-sigma regulatory factor (Ser/Thr protein kinase)
VSLPHPPPAAAVLASPPPRSAECLLPAVPASVGVARDVVRDELGRWGAAALVEDCALIVSELATNAVRHGGTAFAFRIAADDVGVHGEIFDTGAGLPTVREPDLDASGGRGMMIVDLLADEWGVVRTPRGKSVWFLMRVPPPR